MKNKQLIILFLCNLIIFTAAGGLIPLLPIYLTRLGASSAVAGLYLGFGFLMLIASAALMGRLRRRLTPHTLFITMTLLMGVAIILVGQASSLFVLLVFISLWWFGAGIAMILINIFAGLGGFVGYASGGYLLATIESDRLFWGAAILGLTAVLLLGLSRNGRLSTPVAASQQ